MNHISSDTLREYLPENPETIIVISYGNGNYAMRASVSDTMVLARHKQVYGIEKRGALRSVRLSVSIHAAYRTLAACRAVSVAPAGAITKNRTPRGAQKWPVRLDNAKTGCGGFHHIFLQGARIA